MRYADASRVSSFLRQLVVASVILPFDVVFCSSTRFFGLGACLVFWLEYQGLMVHVRKTMKMRREEQKEFGVGVVDFFLFFSLRSIFFYMPEYQHGMSVVRKTRCRYPINKHGKV